jgi:hypothetical protein
MTQPVITLTQPRLDELRVMARRQYELDPDRHRLVMQGQGIKMHTEGKFGQEAVAVYLCVDNPDRLMASVADFAADNDVYGIQVRATTHTYGHLITKPNDKPGPYVLVTLERVNYNLVYATLRGWAWLHECNIDARWRTHGPNGQLLPRSCYMTPQSALHPIDTVPIPNQLKGQQ